MNAASAIVVILFWTNPGKKAATVVIPPDQRESPGDSIAIVCGMPGDPINNLDSAIVYSQPRTGGPRRRAYAKSVRGREGLPDSTAFVGEEGHFDVTFKRIGSPESCPSNRAYIGTVTAVEFPPRSPRVIREEWFDIHGRRVKGPEGTGIRMVRWSVDGKFIGSQKAVLHRGKVLTRLRRPEP